MKVRISRPALALISMAVFAAGLPAQPVLAARDSGQTQASTRDLYLMLIRQARQDGHSRAALAFLDDFERQYPGEFDAQILRINCLLDLGQTEEAQAAAASLTARDSSGPVRAIRGHVLTAQGRWKEAIAEYGAALQRLPTDALLNNAMGYAQLRDGMASDAVETLRRARELAPQDPVIRNNLLLALTMAGREQEADAAFTRIGEGPAVEALRKQVLAEALRLAADAHRPAKGSEP